MDETRFAANFLKNTSEMVFFGVNQWQGKWRCFIRIYYPGPGEGQDWLPTKKGISLEFDHFSALRDAIIALGKDLETERDIAVISQRADLEIRISLGNFKKIKLIDIRTYVQMDGELRPTQKGISLKTEFFPQLWNGIEKLAGLVSDIH